MSDGKQVFSFQKDNKTITAENFDSQSSIFSIYWAENKINQSR